MPTMSPDVYRSDEEIPQPLLDRVVGELNLIARSATLDFALAVGRVIVDGFYGGDLEAWRARGVKDMSFRRLAKHRDLPMSPAALYRSVAVYELSHRLPLTRWQRVSASHLHVVLPLAQGDQERLLELTDVQRWPVRRLRQEVALLSAAPVNCLSQRASDGRPKLQQTIRLLRRCLDETNGLVRAGDPDFEPPQDAVRSITEVIRALKGAFAQLERRFGSTVFATCIEEPPPSE